MFVSCLSDLAYELHEPGQILKFDPEPTFSDLIRETQIPDACLESGINVRRTGKYLQDLVVNRLMNERTPMHLLLTRATQTDLWQRAKDGRVYKRVGCWLSVHERDNVGAMR